MLFDRKYRLEIGRPVIVGKFREDPKNSWSKAIWSEARFSGEAVSNIITDHQIVFKTAQSSGTALNKTTIVVTNLSNESFQFLANTAGKEVFIKLEAGYGEDLRTICVGAMTELKDIFEGNTRKTSFTVTDGITNTKDRLTSLSVAPGTSWKYVIDFLVADLGLPRGLIEYPPEPLDKTAAPWSFDGKSHDGLKKLAEGLGSYYSIQNSFVTFLSKFSKELSPNAPVKSLTPSTGLIGSPAPVANTSGTSADAVGVPIVGVRFKSLLDGALLPTSLVRLDSKQFVGVFRIVKVSHTGDSRGQNWYSECEATQLSPFIDFDDRI